MLSPNANRKGKNIKIISLVLVLSLLLALAGVTANRQGITWPEEILQFVVAPVQGVFQRLTRSVEGLLATAKNYQLLLAENERMREQLAVATSLEARLVELREENDRLRRMLDLRAASSYELMSAEVIARDPSNWFNTITINKGSRHGVEQGMAVVTTDGLIGNIDSVSPTSAHVLLLTDGRRGVGALVQRSREPGAVGVVENDPDNAAYLRMKDLPREANIQAGDTIISSGLGGFFPKGLVIGYVINAETDEMGLTQYAQVLPAANFNRLEEVFIVIPQNVPEVIPDEGDDF